MNNTLTNNDTNSDVTCMTVINIENKSANNRISLAGGVYIQFNSIKNVSVKQYFSISLDNSTYYFQAIDIKVNDEYRELLLVTAVEVGYWASKLDYKKIDLRLLVGSEVFEIDADNVIGTIQEQSCWC